MKVGRVKFAVKEIRYSNNMEVETKVEEMLPEEEFEEYEEVESVMKMEEGALQEDEYKRCRFCWLTEADESNPLFTSCKCAGSVGFIHYNCLRNWLQVKR